jgi:hypothetical protein
LNDRVIALQGERRGHVAAALGCLILLCERCRIYLRRRRRGHGKGEQGR